MLAIHFFTNIDKEILESDWSLVSDGFPFHD